MKSPPVVDGGPANCFISHRDTELSDCDEKARSQQTDVHFVPPQLQKVAFLWRLICFTAAALFKSIFRYPLQHLCQLSCLCACKFNLFLFQLREPRCYNKMKGGIILLWDLRRKWISRQQHCLTPLFSSPLRSLVIGETSLIYASVALNRGCKTCRFVGFCCKPQHPSPSRRIHLPCLSDSGSQ